MSFYINDTMNNSNITSDGIAGQTGVYTVTSTDNSIVGTGANLYWGINGTSINPGQVLTSNGTSAQWGSITSDPSLKGASLSVKGDADFEGEVTIKGKSLFDMFEKIEERLAILHPNPELEDRWDELKELGKRYKELEQELIEKEKVWNILKK
jgi:hypothetical protein